MIPICNVNKFRKKICMHKIKKKSFFLAIIAPIDYKNVLDDQSFDRKSF